MFHRTTDALTRRTANGNGNGITCGTHRPPFAAATRVLLLAGVVVAALMPLHAASQEVRVVRALPDVMLPVDSGPHGIDLRRVFWGAPERIRAASSDESVATVDIMDGFDMMVTPAGAGETVITIMAMSYDLGMAELDFKVTVGHLPPVAVGEFPAYELRVGETLPLELAGGFSGEALEYSATSSDDSAATVSVSGSTASITAHKAGMASVTVTAANSGGSATQKISLWILDVPPEPVGNLADLTMTVGDDPISVEVAGAFSGSALTFSAASMASELASVAIEGSTVTVTAHAAGMATITVTATNSEGSADQNFVVTVKDVPPMGGSLPDVSLIAGGEAVMVDAASAFAGTALVFSAAVAGDAVSAVMTGGQLTVAPLMEGEATVTVSASNSEGTASVSFQATVSTDAAESDALKNTVAALARSTLASVNSAIGARFRAERMGSVGAPQSSAFTPFDGGRFNTFMQPGMYAGATSSAWAQPNAPCCNGFSGSSPFGYGPTVSTGGLQMLTGMSFALPMNAAGSGGGAWVAPAEWTFWGHVDRQGFDGDGFDGDLTSFYIGADASFGDNWLAGVALSQSSGDADYKFNSAYASGTGEVDTDMVSVFPYVRWSIDEMAEVWAIAGAGWGDVDLDRSATAQEGEADLSMWMLSAGGRRTLASGDEWNFALTGDAGILEMQTDGGVGIIDDMNVDVGRVKLAFEGERVISMENGNRFAVFGQVGGRHDSGDGETGSGVELMGGVRYDSAGRFRVEAKARLLSLHSAGGYDENGVSLSAIVRPRPDGSGMSLALSSYLGTGMSANNASLEQGYGYPGRRMEDYGFESDAWGMDARIGYALKVRRLSGLLTPFASFDMAGDDGHGMRMGLRYDLASQGNATMLNLEFTGGQEYDRWRREAHNMVQLRGELRF